MKQRILVAAASLVLAALILLLLPVSSPDPGISTGPSGTSHSPNQSGSSSTPVVTQPAAPGVVRLYSCEDNVIAVLTELAAEYTTLTGVEVVVMGRDADGCQATLQRYMESEDPPTVFCIHSRSQLNFWKDSLLDLDDTDLAAALCNEGLCMRMDGKLLAIPTAVEGYGLLANLEVLSTVLSRSDIYDFNSLSMWTQILKSNSITPFPPAAPTLRDAWHLLIGEDLDSTKAFLDLYLANSSISGNAMELFLQGKTAFYLGGTWEYDTMASFTDQTMDLRNLDIIPNYAEGAMQYVCSTAWCVNAGARQDDIDATLAFLDWVVTPGEAGTLPIDRLQILTPFTGANWYGNQLEKKLRHYMQKEGAVLQWKDADSGDKRLLLALTAYMESNTNDNWEVLCQAVSMVKAESGYIEEYITIE